MKGEGKQSSSLEEDLEELAWLEQQQYVPLEASIPRNKLEENE